MVGKRKVLGDVRPVPLYLFSQRVKIRQLIDFNVRIEEIDSCVVRPAVQVLYPLLVVLCQP